VFRRPASEAVARLLGADNVARGIVVDPHRIAIGDGVAVTAAGPALTGGEHVGWSFSPSRARITAAGPYQGRVESVASMGVGHQITVCLGDARVRIFDGQTAPVPGETCSFDIDPGSIQIWPLD
jgi:ABC-type Fe3+/spermidine/putrescine transport system ATPase subunit